MVNNMNINNFLDNGFKMVLYDKKIDIINYEKIISINDLNIKLLSNKLIDISGSNLKIIKLVDKEILVKGDINNIEIK